MAKGIRPDVAETCFLAEVLPIGMERSVGVGSVQGVDQGSAHREPDPVLLHHPPLHGYPLLDDLGGVEINGSMSGLLFLNSLVRNFAFAAFFWMSPFSQA